MHQRLAHDDELSFHTGSQQGVRFIFGKRLTAREVFDKGSRLINVY